MSKKLNVILIIIIIVLLSYIFIDKYISKNTVEHGVNESEKDINSSTETIKYYTYNKDNVYKSVYLFDDKTYYYTLASDECNHWSKGKYNMSDNEVELIEEMYAGCDRCYYTDNLTNYKFMIDDEGLISSDNEKLLSSVAHIRPIVDVELIDGIKNCTN